MDFGQGCLDSFVLGDCVAAAADAGIAAATDAAAAGRIDAAAAACTFLSCSSLDYLNLCLLYRQAEHHRRTRHADLRPLLLQRPSDYILF